jgi:hypothetical protein
MPVRCVFACDIISVNTAVEYAVYHELLSPVSTVNSSTASLLSDSADMCNISSKEIIIKAEDEREYSSSLSPPPAVLLTPKKSQNFGWWCF